MVPGPFSKTLLCAAILAAILVSFPHVVHATDPLLRLRAADTNVTIESGGVVAWRDPVSGITARVGTGQSKPTLLPNAVNNQSAISFSGDSYLTVNNSSCFTDSYSLYVVLTPSGVVSENNIVSGNNHSLWLANTAYPHVMHDSNFDQQGVSEVAIETWSVVRVIFDAATGLVRIAVNNVEGAATVIPSTNDPTFLIGAYRGSDNFYGEIAEVVYYDGVISEGDRYNEDIVLHTRYGIPRAADPPPSIIDFSIKPKRLAIVPYGDSIRVDGLVMDSSVLTVELTLDSNGLVVDRRHWTVASDGHRLLFSRAMPMSGLHDYRMLITVSRSGTRDTVLFADSIASGVVFAISGQSNSVAVDWAGMRSPWARTFGINASSDPADTTWMLSDPFLYGGGGTIGAWGKFLQDYLASRSIASAVINGGSSASSIEQHLPRASNPEELSTLYGSLAYRRRIAGVNPYINWMFWYQGESDNGAEDYLGKFDQLYKQWHKEMPNLKRIVVMQVRPGCSAGNQALLREKLRRLQHLYSDVMVVATAALPEHELDHCHLGRNGFLALSNILSHHLDAAGLDASGPLSAEWSSPDIVSATYPENSRRSVSLRFAGYQNSVPSLVMIPSVEIDSAVRSRLHAFYADGDEMLTPVSMEVDGDSVILTFAKAVSTISYVPGYFYPGTREFYEGPWLTNDLGVGALTFFEFPVYTPEIQIATLGSRVVHVGDQFTLSGNTLGPLRILDVRGAEVFTTTISDNILTIPPLTPAAYIILSGRERAFVLVQ